MKRLVATLAVVLSAAMALPAQAHGMGGWRGGYSHHYHGGGWRGDWVGPVLGAAIVGGAVYAATRPTYGPTYVAPPPVVVMPAQQPVAYYCATWGQYYPTVQTCPVPWQPVTY